MVEFVLESNTRLPPALGIQTPGLVLAGPIHPSGSLLLVMWDLEVSWVLSGFWEPVGGCEHKSKLAPPLLED